MATSVSPERLIAVADPDERLRDAISALVFLQFGLECCSAPSLSALISSLAGRYPSILIAAGDSREHMPPYLVNWMPFVPVVALGAPPRYVAATRIRAVVQRPVDGDYLIALIGQAEKGRRVSEPTPGESILVSPAGRYLN